MAGITFLSSGKLATFKSGQTAGLEMTRFITMDRPFSSGQNDSTFSGIRPNDGRPDRFSRT